MTCFLTVCTLQGFSATLNAIVTNIPRSRQTLLFSATQTKSVKDLARLSLKVGVAAGWLAGTRVCTSTAAADREDEA